MTFSTNRLLGYVLPCRSKENSNVLIDSWVTTFADLVTLLLCFFLVLLAHSAEESKSKSNVASKDFLASQTGTTTAKLSHAREFVSFLIPKEELLALAQGRESIEFAKAINLIRSVDYGDAEVFVKVFLGEPEGAEGERWLSIIRITGEIQRQIIDVTPATPLKLEFIGNRAELNVEIEIRNRKNHG